MTKHGISRRSPPSLFDASCTTIFEALEPRGIVAYRYVVEAVCLGVADDNIVRQVTTQTLEPRIDSVSESGGGVTIVCDGDCPLCIGLRGFLRPRRSRMSTPFSFQPVDFASQAPANSTAKPEMGGRYTTARPLHRVALPLAPQNQDGNTEFNSQQQSWLMHSAGASEHDTTQ